ncbi:hypothetical protein ACHAWF_007364, partial [Thalassiosira exigua]
VRGGACPSLLFLARDHKDIVSHSSAVATAQRLRPSVAQLIAWQAASPVHCTDGIAQRSSFCSCSHATTKCL